MTDNNDQELLRLAFKDETTGLNNKNYYFQIRKSIAEQMISDSGKNIWSVLFCDVNNLKFVNDTVGHQVGDQGLKFLGALIRNTIRSNRTPSDDYIPVTSDLGENISIRFGGDEFLIILPNCTKEQAQIVKNRINNRIDENLEYTQNLSLAIGIADTTEISSIDDIKDSNKVTYFLERLIKKAEENMYKDKSKNIKELSLEEQVQIISRNIHRLGSIGIDYRNPQDIELIINALNEYRKFLEESEEKIKR